MELVMTYETGFPLFVLNNMPWIWLGIAVLMTIIEGMTMGLTTIWLAISALAAMVLAFFIPSVTAQITIFLILSIALFLFTRPVAVKKMKLGKNKTNADRLIDTVVRVAEPLQEDLPGQVKAGGQMWTARLEGGTGSLEKGDFCRILRIEGVTLLVRPEAEEKSVPEAGEKE